MLEWLQNLVSSFNWYPITLKQKAVCRRCSNFLFVLQGSAEASFLTVVCLSSISQRQGNIIKSVIYSKDAYSKWLIIKEEDYINDMIPLLSVCCSYTSADWSLARSTVTETWSIFSYVFC